MSLKKELNKWQVSIGFIRSTEVLPIAWRFRFAVCKFISFGDYGSIQDKHKGILWESKIIWHPLTLIKRFLNDRSKY